MVRFELGLTVGVVNPHPAAKRSRVLSQDAHFFKQLRRGALAKSSSGRALRRAWKLLQARRLVVRQKRRNPPLGGSHPGAEAPGGMDQVYPTCSFLTNPGFLPFLSRPACRPPRSASQSAKASFQRSRLDGQLERPPMPSTSWPSGTASRSTSDDPRDHEDHDEAEHTKTLSSEDGLASSSSLQASPPLRNLSGSIGPSPTTTPSRPCSTVTESQHSSNRPVPSVARSCTPSRSSLGWPPGPAKTRRCGTI